MIDLNSLTYFKKVAELQHFTLAAEELRVAQSSLSRTISRLEQSLGVQLFDRSGRNVTLNPYGEIVLRHTNRILQELHDIERELADYSDQSHQLVTLSLYAASKLLPQLVTTFKQRYPSIRLKVIQESPSSEISEECDLTLSSSIYPLSAPNTITLFSEDILLALPESSPLANRPCVNLIEVSHEQFICLHKGKSLRKITDTYCQIAGFEPSVVLESDSPEIVRELIHAGIGISFIPSITWQGMETRNLALIPIHFPQCKRYIQLSWRNEGYLPSAAVIFRDFMKEYFRDFKKS